MSAPVADELRNVVDEDRFVAVLRELAELRKHVEPIRQVTGYCGEDFAFKTVNDLRDWYVATYPSVP